MRKLQPADYLFWAVSQQTGNPIRNLILIQLCNRVGKNGTCYPSIQRIASDCETSTRTVIRHIQALEEDGFIAPERRAIDGMKTSHLYRFPLVKSDMTESHNDMTESHKGCDTVSLGVVTESHIKHPLLNTQLNTHTPHSPPAQISDFDRFYDAYPRKTGRRDAEKAWKKLNPQPALINRIMQDIVARVERGHWCTGKGKQYIPGPAPYLNQERWTDEIIPRPDFKPAVDYSQLAADAQDLSENL